MSKEGYADAHCHLTPPWFTLEQVEKVVKECSTAKVNIIINSAIMPENYEFGLKTELLPSIFLTVGLDYSVYSDNTIKNFKEFVMKHKSKIKAIGEIGLDHHWVKDSNEQKNQAKYFAILSEFAIENNFPLVIHSRKAEQEAINILKDLEAEKVLMHCFDGNEEELKEIIDNDWYVSVPTSAVYRKRYMKRTKLIPIEQLMLETDSPFHSLKHGENNTPCSIPILVRHLAKFLEIEEKDVQNQTTKNVKKFYLGN